jgi:hypothetical protein
MDSKFQFVIDELWIMAWNGSVQRAKLYKENINSDSEKVKKFRKSIIRFIVTKLIPIYSISCTEDQHYKNIQSLIDYVNNINLGILREAGYRYGIAQKLLNLALKYYWCLDLISDPPHCPVDRIVISKTKYSGSINWTQINEKNQYQKIIDEIRILANREQLSIPMWELTIFNRR